MGNAIRMRDRDTIEVAVDGRSVVIRGELGTRVADGGPAFWLMGSSQWTWADGRAMSDAERLHLVGALPGIAAANGWLFELDERPKPHVTFRDAD